MREGEEERGGKHRRNRERKVEWKTKKRREGTRRGERGKEERRRKNWTRQRRPR